MRASGVVTSRRTSSRMKVATKKVFKALKSRICSALETRLL